MRPGRHCVEGAEWGNYDAFYLANGESTPKGRMEIWYLVGSRSNDARADPGVYSEARERSTR